LDIERENKEAFFMSKKLIKVGIGLGLLALGAAYLGKKTGLFEDDSHLYDEFESI
jgi:predicted RNA methylase